jgi:hypothetical protein
VAAPTKNLPISRSPWEPFFQAFVPSERDRAQQRLDPVLAFFPAKNVRTEQPFSAVPVGARYIVPNGVSHFPGRKCVYQPCRFRLLILGGRGGLMPEKAWCPAASLGVMRVGASPFNNYALNLKIQDATYFPVRRTPNCRANFWYASVQLLPSVLRR